MSFSFTPVSVVTAAAWLLLLLEGASAGVYCCSFFSVLFITITTIATLFSSSSGCFCCYYYYYYDDLLFACISCASHRSEANTLTFGEHSSSLTIHYFFAADALLCSALLFFGFFRFKRLLLRLRSTASEAMWILILFGARVFQISCPCALKHYNNNNNNNNSIGVVLSRCQPATHDGQVFVIELRRARRADRDRRATNGARNQ